jgi:hypothetical protein
MLRCWPGDFPTKRGPWMPRAQPGQADLLMLRLYQWVPAFKLRWVRGASTGLRKSKGAAIHAGTSHSQDQATWYEPDELPIWDIAPTPPLRGPTHRRQALVALRVPHGFSNPPSVIHETRREVRREVRAEAPTSLPEESISSVYNMVSSSLHLDRLPITMLSSTSFACVSF